MGIMRKTSPNAIIFHPVLITIPPNTLEQKAKARALTYHTNESPAKTKEYLLETTAAAVALINLGN